MTAAALPQTKSAPAAGPSPAHGPRRRLTGEPRPELPLGRALAATRAIFAVEQQELADAAGMRRAALAQTEAGFIHLHTHQLARLVGLVVAIAAQRSFAPAENRGAGDGEPSA